MRHPVIITSLEEDFRAIGILPKEEAKQPEPEAPEETPEGEELGEGKRRAAWGRKMVKTRKMRGKKKISSERYERTHRSQRKKARLKREKKMAVQRRELTLKNLNTDVDTTTARINSLLDDVQDIISTVDDESIENAVKSFANVAIISEMLARVFEAVKDEFEDDDAKELGEAAEFFGELAEEAASIATMLHEGVDEDTPDDEVPTYEDIEAKFQEHMDALIDGLELYADITEDEDEEDPTEETDEEVEED